MDNNVHLLSATVIGRKIGVTPMEFNRLMKNQGFLDGEWNAYGLTPKGENFGVHQSHDNGYGGHGHKAWETMRYSPNIADELDYSPESLAVVREEILARRQELSAARMVAQAEAEVHYAALRANKEAAEAKYEIDPQKVLIVIAGLVAIAVASYGVYQGVQRYKRKKEAQAVAGVGVSA